MLVGGGGGGRCFFPTIVPRWTFIFAIFCSICASPTADGNPCSNGLITAMTIFQVLGVGHLTRKAFQRLGGEKELDRKGQVVNNFFFFLSGGILVIPDLL